jgi:hypothetical protein
VAPLTGLHPALAFTTVRVTVTGSPLRPSRMSLRTKSDNDGKGPTVSVGATAQAPDEVLQAAHHRHGHGLVDAPDRRPEGGGEGFGPGGGAHDQGHGPVSGRGVW